MGITTNENRIGKFTSSEIWKLTKKAVDKTKFGAPALAYIQEKKYEAKLKRSLSVEAASKPMKWGTFLESRVHDLLPLGYKHTFDETLNHPFFKCWAGSPDSLMPAESVVCDMKCPQPKAFCELIDNLTKAVIYSDIDYFRKNHHEYYWQLVSNALITESKFIELIVYMPYESELPEIRQAAENFDGLDQWKYRFISESSNEELAYLPDNSDYKNLNVFRFQLNQEDAEFLTQCVVKANVELQKP